MPTISLCMITKNEGKLLRNSLNSVKDLVDEIIIIDTGSTDNTKKIAREFTEKVYDFEWCDDFAAARNESLKHATGDWILVLDGDEELDEEGRNLIRNVVQNNENTVQNNEFSAYSMPQLHYTNKFVEHTDFVEIKDPRFRGFFATSVIRLFKNSDDIRFDYCVHETVRESVLKLNQKIGELLAPIHHYQELKGIEDVEKKQEFYFRLSLNNIKQYPNYAKSYNDVAIYYNSHENNQEKALEYCKKAIELEPRKVEYILNLSYRLRELGRYNEAIEFLSNALSSVEDERIYQALGFLYYTIKNRDKAVESYEKAIQLGTPVAERLRRQINTIKREIEQNKL